jgi:hypothetical protein
MKEFNPYAAPEVDIDTGPRHADGADVWRDGKNLIMAKGAPLPDRCLKCNAPAEGIVLKRKLSWHPPLYYAVLFLVGPIPYVVIALIVRKTAPGQLPFCPMHRRKRRRAIAVGWLLALAGVVLVLTGASLNDPVNGYLALSGLIVAIIGLIYGVARSQIPSPSKIDKEYVWLKGVSPALLATLPPW